MSAGTAGPEQPVIGIERRPGVVRLVLQRPEGGNVLDLALARQLLAAVRAAEADPEVYVLTLTGTGRFFCGGGDVGNMAGSPPAERSAFIAALAEAAHEVALALVHSRLLVLAGARPG
ncbi:MAG: enoyl-CoA hydratase-related protein, partial [Micrococcaceae bacterium]|nr:enoyl-CoA hydratase-related protein [Micrococcaceae bacterium]